jgi:hypothetical protein
MATSIEPDRADRDIGRSALDRAPVTALPAGQRRPCPPAVRLVSATLRARNRTAPPVKAGTQPRIGPSSPQSRARPTRPWRCRYRRSRPSSVRSRPAARPVCTNHPRGREQDVACGPRPAFASIVAAVIAHHARRHCAQQRPAGRRGHRPRRPPIPPADNAMRPPARPFDVATREERDRTHLWWQCCRPMISPGAA